MSQIEVGAPPAGSPGLELHARDVAMVGGIDPEGGYRMPSPAETPWRATAAALEAAGIRSLEDLTKLLSELRPLEPPAPLAERALRWLVLSAGLEGLCTPDFLAARLGAVTADVAEALLDLQGRGEAEPAPEGAR
ncbi:MAG: hypothetical protein IT372_00125 [Polyangiaceae bacterium]|nr:hypothetical protein [Polyangiaceae bacterium]